MNGSPAGWAGRPLRLVSFNVLHGARPGETGPVDLDRFAAAIAALDPDVLALQEIDHLQPRSGGQDLTRAASDAMAATSSCFLPVLPGLLGAPPASGRTRAEVDSVTDPGYGLALLSRFPALEFRRLRLPRLPVAYPAWRREPGRLGHPERRRDERRGALLGRFQTPAGVLTVVDAHLSYVPGPREAQLLLLRRRLRDVRGPLLVMGDLNCAPPWPDRLLGLRPLARVLTSTNEDPHTQIDHVLARGPWRVHHVEAVDAGLSDHRALVVEASLEP